MVCHRAAICAQLFRVVIFGSLCQKVFAFSDSSEVWAFGLHALVRLNIYILLLCKGITNTHINILCRSFRKFNLRMSSFQTWMRGIIFEGKLNFSRNFFFYLFLSFSKSENNIQTAGYESPTTHLKLFSEKFWYSSFFWTGKMKGLKQLRGKKSSLTEQRIEFLKVREIYLCGNSFGFRRKILWPKN